MREELADAKGRIVQLTVGKARIRRRMEVANETAFEYRVQNADLLKRLEKREEKIEKYRRGFQLLGKDNETLRRKYFNRVERIKELEKDRERLDWIACNAQLVECKGSPEYADENKRVIREAIDAAMKAGETGGGDSDD